MASEDCSENSTGVVIFLLLGIHSVPALKPLLFGVFLTMYLLIVAGHTLILSAIASDVHLHTPMYFFLGNLSVLEIWCTTSVIPTLLGSLIGHGISVSLPVCIGQLTLFAWFLGTECFLLTIMAYDRYVAICHPLRYTALMNPQLCLQLALCSWVTSFIIVMTNIIFMRLLQFPDHNRVDHFVCDLTPLVKAACSDSSQIESEILIVSVIVLSIPLLLVTTSYIFIISAILKIPSTTGKSKAFSTCSSHLTIVIAYFGTLILTYMVPTASNTHDTNEVFSLFYTVGTPIINPIVYTFRSKEMREALKKYLRKNVFLHLTSIVPSKHQVTNALKDDTMQYKVSIEGLNRRSQ